MGAIADPGDEIIYISPPWFFYEVMILAFCRRLAENSVLVLPGSVFEMPGTFRISLTANDEMINRALPAFAAALLSLRE